MEDLRIKALEESVHRLHTRLTDAEGKIEMLYDWMHTMDLIPEPAIDSAAIGIDEG